MTLLILGVMSTEEVVPMLVLHSLELKICQESQQQPHLPGSWPGRCEAAQLPGAVHQAGLSGL